MSSIASPVLTLMIPHPVEIAVAAISLKFQLWMIVSILKPCDRIAGLLLSYCSFHM